MNQTEAIVVTDENAESVLGELGYANTLQTTEALQSAVGSRIYRAVDLIDSKVPDNNFCLVAGTPQNPNVFLNITATDLPGILADSDTTVHIDENRVLRVTSSIPETYKPQNAAPSPAPDLYIEE